MCSTKKLFLKISQNPKRKTCSGPKSRKFIKKRFQHKRFPVDCAKYANMQNSVVMFTFSVLDWKYPFWASLVQKIKIASFSWNLVLDYFKYVKFNGDVLFFKPVAFLVTSFKKIFNINYIYTYINAKNWNRQKIYW